MLRIENKYLRFLTNCIIFIVLIFTLDFILGNGLRYLYFKQKSGGNYRLIYSIGKTDAEIIILGSSRANHHYIPDIIEDSLNLTCFNTGMDGHNIPTSYAIFKSITKRYNPEAIIMELTPDELIAGFNNYEELTYLLPFYRNNEEIRNVIHLKSKFERLKLLSKIYPFNSSLLSVGNDIFKKESNIKFKGYLPLSGNLPVNTDFRKEQNEGRIEFNKKLDTNTIKLLDEIASDCNTYQIQLIFIQSPIYIEVDQATSLNAMNNIITKYNVAFWNYVNDTMFLKPEFFRDPFHLNDSGAHVFTEAVAGRLKRRAPYNTDIEDKPWE